MVRMHPVVEEVLLRPLDSLLVTPLPGVALCAPSRVWHRRLRGRSCGGLGRRYVALLLLVRDLLLRVPAARPVMGVVESPGPSPQSYPRLNVVLGVVRPLDLLQAVVA